MKRSMLFLLSLLVMCAPLVSAAADDCTLAVEVLEEREVNATWIDTHYLARVCGGATDYPTYEALTPGLVIQPAHFPGEFYARLTAAERGVYALKVSSAAGGGEAIVSVTIP